MSSSDGHLRSYSQAHHTRTLYTVVFPYGVYTLQCAQVDGTVPIAVGGSGHMLATAIGLGIFYLHRDETDSSAG